MFKQIKILFLLIISLFLIGAKRVEKTLYLKDQFKNATKGQYFVLAIAGNATLFHIHSKENEQLVLEEVSFPLQSVNLKKTNLHQYLNQNAPQHTSWILSKMNLETGNVEQSYSFVQRAHLNRTQEFDFFQTLMNLKFEPLPIEKQRKVGIAPRPNEPDRRVLWRPPLPKNLKNSKAKIHVYKALWPKDGSDLAQKTLEIYFLDGVFFPIWIEVKGAPIKHKLFVLECGDQLQSPKKQIPLTPLYFVHPPIRIKNKIKFTLPSTENPKNLNIYLSDDSHIHPLNFRYKKEQKGYLVEIENIDTSLKSGKVVITSKEHPEKTIESNWLKLN